MTIEQAEKRFSYRLFMIIGMMGGGLFVGVSQFVLGSLWPGCLIIGLFAILVILLTFIDLQKVPLT